MKKAKKKHLWCVEIKIQSLIGINHVCCQGGWAWTIYQLRPGTRITKTSFQKEGCFGVSFKLVYLCIKIRKCKMYKMCINCSLFFKPDLSKYFVELPMINLVDICWSCNLCNWDELCNWAYKFAVFVFNPVFTVVWASASERRYAESDRKTGWRLEDCG